MNQIDLEEIEAALRTLAEKFVPRTMLVSIAKQLLKERDYGDQEKREIRSKKIVKKILTSLDTDDAWLIRKTTIFGGTYPKRLNEFYCSGRFSIFAKSAEDLGQPISYRVKSVLTVSNPSRNQLIEMAPKLAKVVNGKLSNSAEMDRLKIYQQEKVKESALVQIEILNRPTVGVKKGWVLRGKDLPLKILVPTIEGSARDKLIIENFLVDLREAVAWKSEGSLVNYLACLLQPMLVRLNPGMFPAYLFRGPTKSGKGFLTKKLLDWFYKSNLPRAVSQNRLPQNDYEMSVSLSQAQNCLYYACDEVRDLSLSQMKIFDNLVTSAELDVRIMREGYFKIPNHLTLTMTAVHADFTEETWGRIALIELVESRTSSIEAFLKKWQNLAPDLLASIFTILNSKLESLLDYKVIEKRRPGFGLIAKATYLVFGLKPSFSSPQAVNDILETICALENNPKIGDIKSGSKRLSKVQVRKEFEQRSDARLSPSDFGTRLATCLHAGKAKIYQAEDGNIYRLRISEEGSSKRSFIYVSKIVR